METIQIAFVFPVNQSEVARKHISKSFGRKFLEKDVCIAPSGEYAVIALRWRKIASFKRFSENSNSMRSLGEKIKKIKSRSWIHIDIFVHLHSKGNDVGMSFGDVPFVVETVGGLGS
jgi:hypothetical protein